jgi:hypothetical protein
MSEDLFKRTRSLLLDHIRFLDQHSIGDTRADQAQVIVDEIDILLKSEELKSIENTIDDAERKTVSSDLADEIINSKYCVGGACED